ncbi:MAG: lysozyme inhibitor LprI family protein [Flavobacteriales bacterium]
MKIGTVLLALLLSDSCSAQGDLSYLKDMDYLEFYRAQPFNCDSLGDEEATTLHDRICENLRLQRSDSLLNVYYDSLVVEIRKVDGDTLLGTFEELQRTWREFRDRHCRVLIGDIVSNGSAAAVMFEMRKLTEIRIEELKRLLARYHQD